MVPHSTGWELPRKVTSQLIEDYDKDGRTMKAKLTGIITMCISMLVGCGDPTGNTNRFNDGQIWWGFSFVDPFEQKTVVKDYQVAVNSLGGGSSKLSINGECSFLGRELQASSYKVSEPTECRFAGLSSTAPTMRIDSGSWNMEYYGPCENKKTKLFAELHGRFDGLIAGRIGSGHVTIRVSGSNVADTCVRREPPDPPCYKACW